MEAPIAKLLSYLLPVGIAALFAKGIIWLLQDEFATLFKALFKEIRSMLRAKVTLKGLNAHGLLLLFIFLIIASVLGYETVPKQNPNYALALAETAARAFYMLMFVGALIYCLYLTKSARDD